MIRRNDDATLIFHEVNPLPQTDWRWWAALGVVVLVGIVAFLTRPGYAPPPPIVITAPAADPLPAVVAATTLDVSGEWIGYLYIDGYEDVHHTWSLSLQQDGNTITGTSFIQSNYIFDAGGGVDNGYSPIQTTSALMSVQGTVDPTRERIYFQEMQLIAADFAPENASWCHKSGEMMVNIKVMTGVNIAAGNCGMVNIVLTRKR